MSKARAKMTLAAAAAKRREKTTRPINLKTLVRVYLLDGTYKLLQMDAESIVEDILVQMKFNLNLQDISTFAIFTVSNNNNNIRNEEKEEVEELRRLKLDVKISSVVGQIDSCGKEIKLLFKSWIYSRCCVFETLALQPTRFVKEATAEIWLLFNEATHQVASGNLMLTEEESILLGCLKLQAESGDYKHDVHTTAVIKQRVVETFPEPVCSTLEDMNETKGTILKKANNEYVSLLERITQVYRRVSGKSKVECQIEYVYTLRMWSPYFGASRFNVMCQYDNDPSNKSSNPPTFKTTAIISPLAIYLKPISDEEEEDGGGGDKARIVRNAYNRIIRWVIQSDKRLFAYWIVQSKYNIDDISAVMAKFNSGNYEELNNYADCVYLLCDHADEIGHLVKSYVALSTKGVFPCLPNAPVDLMHPYPSGNEPWEEEAAGFGDGGGAVGAVGAGGAGGEDGKKSTISAPSQLNESSVGNIKSTTGNNPSSTSSSSSTISSITSTSTSTTSSAPSSATPRRQSMWGSLFASVAKDDVSSTSTITSLSASSITDSTSTNNSGMTGGASASITISPPCGSSSSSNNNISNARRASFIDPAVLAAAIEKEKFEESDEDDDATGSDAGAEDDDSDDSGAGARGSDSD